MLFTAYGLVLSASHSFPELPPATGAPDYDVRWNTAAVVPRNPRWSVLWRLPDGEVSVTVARNDEEYYSRFDGYLGVRAAGTCIEVERRGHAAPATLRHLFLDQALPLVLAAQGQLVLHASAVALDGRAVLLAGAAGAGKSTLAAQLALTGAEVIADDGVVLREDARAALQAAGSYPGLRLFEDSATVAGYRPIEAPAVAEYTRKRRFIPPRCAESSPGVVPLGPVYLLDQTPGALEFSRLSRRDLIVAILHHVYRADLADRAHLRAQLERLAGWSDRIDAWRLTFPRQLCGSAEVASAIAVHARKQATSARSETPESAAGGGGVAIREA